MQRPGIIAGFLCVCLGFFFLVAQLLVFEMKESEAFCDHSCLGFFPQEVFANK